MFTYDEALYSDLHKDAYGFRPYSDDPFYVVGPERKQKIWERVLHDLDLEFERVQALEKTAIESFEKQIEQNMTLGAKDRVTAVRWIVQAIAEEHPNMMNWIEQDKTYLCYVLGLPYCMVNEFEEI